MIVSLHLLLVLVCIWVELPWLQLLRLVNVTQFLLVYVLILLLLLPIGHRVVLPDVPRREIDGLASLQIYCIRWYLLFLIIYDLVFYQIC